MNRRQSLIGLSSVAGHALFPAVLERFAQATAATATTAPPALDWRPELLSPGQALVLAEVVDTILPDTDTPGAKAAHVHVFVDLALARCVPPPGQSAVRAALGALGAAFLRATPAVRQRRLARVTKPALDLLTELTVLGYFTSEIGATQALAYDPVPGGFRGCVPLAPGQKAWATS